MSEGCYLYVIAPVGASKPCKIGIAASPSDRLRQLQTGNPMRLEIVEQYWASSRDQASYWELLAHKLYGDRRLAGEWFDVIALDVQNKVEHWQRDREPKSPPRRRNFKPDPQLENDYEPFHPVIPDHLRGKRVADMDDTERATYWACFDLPRPPYGFDDWYIVGSPSSGVLAAFPIVGFSN